MEFGDIHEAHERLIDCLITLRSAIQEENAAKQAMDHARKGDTQDDAQHRWRMTRNDSRLARQEAKQAMQYHRDAIRKAFS